MKIKAGFIQFNPILGSPEKNIRSLTPLLDHAEGADLVVIPELANSGYNFSSKKQALEASENIPDGDFMRFLINKAKQIQLHIVSGINEREGDMLYNTAVFVGPDGYIGKYRKMHLFMNEFDIFEKGDTGFPVFTMGCVQLGMLVCFDWAFPEAWRILALKGADIICHPSNLVLPHAQQAVPVHSLVNKVFTITANRFGSEGNITFSGKSFISGPMGETLVTAPSQGDACIITELNTSDARNKLVTDRNDVVMDRRTDHYGEIMNL